MNPAMRSYLAEFLGTFTLVLVGTSVATLQEFIPGHTGTGFLEISFAFGFTLMVLVLVVGPVSGCHVNPAVTIPMAISGRLPWSQVPGYIISQFGGALVASIVLLALLKGIPTYKKVTMGLGANGNPQKMKIGALFAWEVIITALFLFTIFSVTRPDSPTGFAALAIGGFLFVAHLIGAQLGDSSLNPARSFGPAVVLGGEFLKILWLFIVAPIVGGILGMVFYKVIYDD